jgi:hypothetical protein
MVRSGKHHFGVDVKIDSRLDEMKRRYVVYVVPVN